jgi:hypothetical protein
MAAGSAEESLKARIRAARTLSSDGTKVIYDLTSGIDFSKPRRTAEAIAQVIWYQDAYDWWRWQGGMLHFAPKRRVEIRLPDDGNAKVAKAAADFRDELEHEFAPHIGSYIKQVRDDRTDWFTIFFLGPLMAYLLERLDNREKARAELDGRFSEIASYISVTTA